MNEAWMDVIKLKKVIGWVAILRKEKGKETPRIREWVESPVAWSPRSVAWTKIPADAVTTT